MTCIHCGQQALGDLLDGDSVHPLCWVCIYRLLADVERVGTRLTLTVEPVRVPS